MSKDTTTSARTRRIFVRVSDGELRVLRQTARRERCTVSALVRSAVAEKWLNNRLEEGTSHVD